MNDDFEKLNKELDDIENEVSKPGAWETLVLEERLLTLSKGGASSKEVQHEIFLDVCRYGLDALKDYPENLSDSPAAPALLKYIQTALKSYLDDVDDAKIKINATDRREFLASAFRLTGKSGNGITKKERKDICDAFSDAMDERPNGSMEERNEKDITSAKRAAYKIHHKTEWVKDDGADKKRMTVIGNILREEGYLP